MGASILYLTEDSSSQATRTLQAVTCELFKLVDPKCRPNKITTEPATGEHKQVVSGNMWRSTNSRDRQKNVEFIKYMATKMVQDNALIVFHIDGDTVWSNRHSSNTVMQFETLVIEKVKLRLSMLKFTFDPAKLIRVTPFYSMEAWLYQNTTEAQRICSEKYQRKHFDMFAGWASNRHQLDEIVKIKEKTCLGNKHNEDLAKNAFPSVDVLSIQKSFADTVLSMKASSALVRMLEQTRRPNA